MHPVIEITTNPFAGDSFNLIACGLWAFIVICIIGSVIEYKQRKD
jgi:hypothetical protein